MYPYAIINFHELTPAALCDVPPLIPGRTIVITQHDINNIIIG
ncbi:hypothetical protein CLV51_101701 [Chitinophaga niastensis]|uniref:Uncharacterized protein n=1 Tax=Chitinophaga niastensis TaxID=536980 RepID=A0A2P8HT15_CHINA|nr:hypothetical protein CLV51_101701 [Chitinophaga niastensis]